MPRPISTALSSSLGWMRQNWTCLKPRQICGVVPQTQLLSGAISILRRWTHSSSSQIEVCKSLTLLQMIPQLSAKQGVTTSSTCCCTHIVTNQVKQAMIGMLKGHPSGMPHVARCLSPMPPPSSMCLWRWSSMTLRARIISREIPAFERILKLVFFGSKLKKLAKIYHKSALANLIFTCLL